MSASHDSFSGPQKAVKHVMSYDLDQFRNFINKFHGEGHAIDVPETFIKVNEIDGSTAVYKLISHFPGLKLCLTEKSSNPEKPNSLMLYVNSPNMSNGMVGGYIQKERHSVSSRNPVESYRMDFLNFNDNKFNTDGYEKFYMNGIPVYRKLDYFTTKWIYRLFELTEASPTVEINLETKDHHVVIMEKFHSIFLKAKSIQKAKM